MGTFVQRSNTVWVALILDESGSMSPIWDDTIGGANAYFDKFREENTAIAYRVTIMKFDTEYRPLCINAPMSEVPILDRQNYCPRGCTALYDAVGKVLAETESQVQEGDKALVLIVTDGQENSSVEHTRASIKPWVERLQGQGNWTFVYLGAVADAWAEAGAMGIVRGNVASYTTDCAGPAWTAATSGTACYAKSANMSSSEFYNDYVPKVKGVTPVDAPDQPTQ